MALYNEVIQSFDESHEKIKIDFGINRDDPVLVEIYNDIGSAEFSGNHAKINSVKIPKKYKDYWYLRNYNGKECVCINYDGFLLDRVRNIVNNKQYCEEQINSIKRLLNEA